MNGMVEFVRALGAARLAAMAAVTVALIGFFVVIGMRVSAPTMAPLFTELSMEDSNRVVKELESQGIPFELRGDGSTVWIPKEQVTRTRRLWPSIHSPLSLSHRRDVEATRKLAASWPEVVVRRHSGAARRFPMTVN